MIVIWDPKQQLRTKLAAKLDQGEGEVCEAASAKDVQDAIAGNGAAAVLVGPSVNPKLALDLATQLRDAAPSVGMVLMRSKPSQSLLRSAMRAGVRDVIAATATGDELDRAVQDAMIADGPRFASGSIAKGKIVTVFAAKGGCGKSFLAANLAVILAREAPGQVALVDLDFDSGDQQIMFRLFGGQTFLDVADNLERLDPDALRSRLSVHESGVHLLAAPSMPGLAETIATEDMHRVFDMLRSAYRFVVIDGPTSYTDQLLAALDVTDDCVLVTSMDVPAVRALKVALQTLDALGFDPNRIRVVLNRADSDVGLRHKEIEKAVKRGIDHHVPSSREVPMSINRGAPIARENPRSKVTAPIAELAAKISLPGPASSTRRASRKEKGR